MNMKQHSPDLWDSIADKYDDLRPDQGLTDPNVRHAWQILLAHHLPGDNLRILDAGCGTGSLSLLLTEMGHQAIGTDFAPAMIDQARQKAKSLKLNAQFAVQDASAPDFPPESFDAIICRQVLWALPDRRAALANWSTLLKPGGILLLIEGLFASGNGMSADAVRNAMPPTLTITETIDLAKSPELWGGPITDQRILFITT
jgi:ubiquinone/menaquinone biosynthesis C-methylase UbiE